jgi:sodium bicarbonate transporter 10
VVGDGCGTGDDVFLMSIVLFFGAFIISTGLKQFKTTGYMSNGVRGFLADFAVIIGILSMTALDYFYGLPTPKLSVPSEFSPTSETRGWLVLDDRLFHNPMWVDAFLAPVFAVLASILLFMDQQITAVIVNNKDYKLKKGCGYHLDLLVLAVVILVSSFFGLPWFVANTIPSICHMQSLSKESATSIPGEKPKFLGVREQRVTYLLISLFTGASVLMVPVLALLPMPVLYGIFLFMGISALRGLPFFDRILLLFMPIKYQPNYTYLKYVRLPRVHLFTVIQVGHCLAPPSPYYMQAICLGVLYFIKSNKATAITFPVMLVAICVIRKCIEWVFSNSELRALDDLLPGKDKEKRMLGYKDVDR